MSINGIARLHRDNREPSKGDVFGPLFGAAVVCAYFCAVLYTVWKAW